MVKRPLWIREAKHRDNVGGRDVAVLDVDNHILAEFFEVVGRDELGADIKVDNRMLAQQFVNVQLLIEVAEELIQAVTFGSPAEEHRAKMTVIATIQEMKRRPF